MEHVGQIRHKERNLLRRGHRFSGGAAAPMLVPNCSFSQPTASPSACPRRRRRLCRRTLRQAAKLGLPSRQQCPLSGQRGRAVLPAANHRQVSTNCSDHKPASFQLRQSSTLATISVNGKPLTEIVASVDFDEVEMKEVYDPNSSLKLSMGLPPVETARGRIDLIMDIASGKVKQVSQPAEEFFYKAYNVSYWTMPEADAVSWLNEQFGTSIAAPEMEAAGEAMASAKEDCVLCIGSVQRVPPGAVCRSREVWYGRVWC